MAKKEIVGRIIFANLLEMPLQKYFAFVKNTEKGRLFKEWLDRGCVRRGNLSQGRVLSSQFKPHSKQDRIIGQYGRNDCDGYEVRYSHAYFQRIYKIGQHFWHSFRESSDEKRLLHRLRRINSRNTLTHHLLLALAEEQQDYLTTGNVLDLKPLTLLRLVSQMQSLARGHSVPHSEIRIPKSICPSWLSRLVRNLTIMLPNGSAQPLKTLTPSRRDRLKCGLNKLLNEENRRIMEREIVSPYNDRELQELLYERFGMNTTRQNVSEIRREEGVPSAAVRGRDFWHFLASPFSNVYSLTAREIVRHVPQTSGVYELRIKEGKIDYPKGSSVVFYIGRSKNLLARIMGYVRPSMTNDNKIIARYLRSVPCNFRFIVVEEPYHAVEERQFYDLFTSMLGASPAGNQVQPGINAEMKNRAAKTSIATSKDYFDNVIRSMAEGLIVLSPKGTIQIVNQAVCKVLGYREQELVGQPVTRIFAEEEEEEVPFKKAGLDKLIKKGSIRSIEKTYVAKDGRKIPVLFSGSVMRDADGNIQGIVCVALDITKRKKTEEALRAARDKAQNYLDIAGVMFLVVDANEKVSLINKKGCELLEYSEAEVIGKNIFDTFIPKRMRKEVRAIFRELMSGNIEPVEYYENPWLTKNGQEKMFSWHNTIIKDEEGNIIGTLSSAFDITERRKLEKEIAEISLREREQMQRDLHDSVCQQLTGIGFLAENLYKDLLKVSKREAESAAEIGRLVSDTMERAEDVARGLKPVSEESDSLMTALEEFVSHISSVSGIECRFTSDKPVLIEDHNVADQLFLIAQEAVNNAVKHAKADRIDISLSGQDKVVTIIVRDDGIGFSGETKKSGGMGLNIMRYRASLIGASLDVRCGESSCTVVECSWRRK